MLRRFLPGLLAALMMPVLLVPLLVSANTAILLNDSAQTVDLLEHVSGLYKAKTAEELFPPGPVITPKAPLDPVEFVAGMNQVSQVDQVEGGRYWLYAKIENQSAIERWVFSPSNAVIDHLHIYLYTAEGVREISAGYLYPNQYDLHYGIDFKLPQGQQLELLVLIESRYYSGVPRFEVVPQSIYKYDLGIHNLIVVSCFGAIGILALYNLFIGFSIRDRSYLYYAAYLVLSIVAWSAAFNGFSQLFQWHSYAILISPFFLTITFNTLYYIHFLELPRHHPGLTRVSYGMVVAGLILTFSSQLFTPGVYMMIYGLSSALWLCFGLYCGVVRLLNGYKPARFFIAAFVVVFCGTAVSIFHLFGLQAPVKNIYLVTLVAQTLDMLLLSLALADRINIFRQQKEQALTQAFEVEHRAMAKEQDANTKLQEALALSEEESQRKSDFLRMVSHELRTPLHSIVSSVDQWKGTDDEFMKQDLLSFISYGASRLRTQVDNLVLLAETEDMSLEPNLMDFEIRPLLDRLCQNVDGLVHDNVEFIFKLSADMGENRMPSVLKGDTYLIEHLLRSVLENACKYTEQGKVEFSISWSSEEHALNIDVEDTGCGMTREQQKTMFNAFVQVSRGLERESEGLGLGLTLCYRLSEILSADFVIQSELGEGTSVHISLPLEPVDKGLSLVPPESAPLGGVLIVEDNVINAQVLERIVAYLGYEVDVVYSGQEAIERLDEKVYNAILMDIQMPVMDGITATRWIRRRSITTPIIAVTANSDPDVRRRCIEVGMNDLMIKPVRRKDIQGVLERQIRSAKTKQ